MELNEWKAIVIFNSSQLNLNPSTSKTSNFVVESVLKRNKIRLKSSLSAQIWSLGSSSCKCCTLGFWPDYNWKARKQKKRFRETVCQILVAFTYNDSQTDKTLAKGFIFLTAGSVFIKKCVMEHISSITEPGSFYFGDLTPSSLTGKDFFPIFELE